MGRKKIDKESIGYLSKQLFRKDNFEGFQFTAGRTPRGISDNEENNFSLSLNFNKESFLPDFTESKLKERLMVTFFPDYERYYHFPISQQAITNLGSIFTELGYEIEDSGGEMWAGEWFWFRVKCSIDELEKHAQILKEKLKDFNRLI